MANRYLVFTALAEARARSAQRAQEMGCSGVGTKYWWGVVRNKTTGAGALQIRSSGIHNEAGLTAPEIAQLISEAELQAANEGWPR
jgi:hypothetical protein